VHPLRLILGIVCLVSALLDAFETVILPRRANGRFRLTRLFYIVSWRPWRWVARRVHNPRKRETMLSFYGPLSLVFLIATWAGALVVGFALVYSAFPNAFVDPQGAGHTFTTDLYVSGTTLFTLGLGDVVPHTVTVRILAVMESGMGLGFVALVIGYFPVLYGAFSRREVNIALLDARAGSPPTAYELIKRHSFEGGGVALVLLLAEWERWSAELLESHISYPVLSFFRSQHSNQSWLGALTTMLDVTSLVLTGIEGVHPGQAKLTFAMARHAAVDLAQVVNARYDPQAPERLTDESFNGLREKLAAAGLKLRTGDEARQKLDRLRSMYEPYLHSTGKNLMLSLPPWRHPEKIRDNWQAGPWDRAIQAKGLAVLGQKPVQPLSSEEHF